MFSTYVLYSERIQKYYYGSTSHLERRLETHNSGYTKWSKIGIPWNLVYFENFETKSEALKREKFFKSGQGREFVKKVLEEQRRV